MCESFLCDWTALSRIGESWVQLHKLLSIWHTNYPCHMIPSSPSTKYNYYSVCIHLHKCYIILHKVPLLSPSQIKSTSRVVLNQTILPHSRQALSSTNFIEKNTNIYDNELVSLDISWNIFFLICLFGVMEVLPFLQSWPNLKIQIVRIDLF